MGNTVVKERLASLDILRGFDLFLLVFIQPVLVAFGQQINVPWLNVVLYQFEHAVWNGFRFWDLVMPLFLFMTGVSMPFSFEKYIVTKGNKSVLYKRIFRRVVLLFILGGIVQGNFLGFDFQHIYFYTNTLQAIAVGYFIAAMLQLHFPFKYQLVACGILMLLYWFPMTFLGDFTPHGNFADKLDCFVLGRFRDGVYWNEDGSWSFGENYTYTWILSSLTFGVTVMMGVFAGKLLKNNTNKLKNVKTLLIWGIAAVMLAWLWNFQMPVNKRLWSCSMVLFSGGLCYMLMALFYYWVDYLGHTKYLNWLKIYGMNSIVAYVLGEAINFRCIVHSLTYGLEQFINDYYPAFLSLGNYMIVFFILRLMYKQKIFLKV